MPRHDTSERVAGELVRLANRAGRLSDEEVDRLIDLFPQFFRKLHTAAGHPDTPVRALTTKFRDAGRRSAPWRPVSGRVAGRPQDGADGNRINRWLLPVDHKQYATRRDATLVEVKYYLQALSFEGSPPVPHDGFADAWQWLVDHPALPGAYLEPVQLRPVRTKEVLEDPRSITSGHLRPLDRGGRHVPANTFLILSRSNQMQGNMTVDEFLLLSAEIVYRHRGNGTFPEHARVPGESVESD